MLALAGVTLLLCAQVVYVIERARETAAATRPPTTFEAAAGWLAANTQPGERVYHTDWDDFPELFFHNTHNTYIVGLDPTYMFLERPDLYRLWRSLGRGEIERPSGPIRERIGSRWAITDRQHTAFLAQAYNDPDMEVVFESPGAVVFRVRG